MTLEVVMNSSWHQKSESGRNLSLLENLDFPAEILAHSAHSHSWGRRLKKGRKPGGKEEGGRREEGGS